MHPPLIEHAAIHMAGGKPIWTGMSDEIPNQYRTLTKRAADILVKPTPWDAVAIDVQVVLMREHGALTRRRPGDNPTSTIARKVMEQMKLNGYTILSGPPTEMMTTPSGPKEGST